MLNLGSRTLANCNNYSNAVRIRARNTRPFFKRPQVTRMPPVPLYLKLSETLQKRWAKFAPMPRNQGSAGAHWQRLTHFREIRTSVVDRAKIKRYTASFYNTGESIIRYFFQIRPRTVWLHGMHVVLYNFVPCCSVQHSAMLLRYWSMDLLPYSQGKHALESEPHYVCFQMGSGGCSDYKYHLITLTTAQEIWSLRPINAV